jgi:hypothetical protein
MFDKEWIENAWKFTDTKSWAHSVMIELDTTGGIYLNTLRMWYEEFPGTEKQKKPLRQRIESFGNEDHLGGVNELSWWKFLQKSNFGAEPVPTTTSARPDFKVQTPTEFFVEVSTLNVSALKSNSLEVKALFHSTTRKPSVACYLNPQMINTNRFPLRTTSDAHAA